MRPPSGTALCVCFCIQLVYSYHTKNDFSSTRNKEKFYSSYNELSGADQNHKLKLRHQSRFQNLDRIKSKLDSLSNDGPHPRYRPHGWSLRSTTTTTTTQSPEYDELFNNNSEGDDYDEDDDFKREEDNEEVNYFDDEEKEDPDKYDDDAEDNDEFYKEFDLDREVQDEGSTTVKPSLKIAESETSSDFTNYKWENYGTFNAIRQTREKMVSLKSSSSIEAKKKAVMAHYNFVRNINQCNIPKPKVIPVQQMHPNSSITYIPHCTVLHRCGEDTGCCEQDKTCQYKTRLEVHLYVYTRLIGSNALQAEKLLFYNDTSCECRAKNQKNPAVIQLTNKGRREITGKAGSSFSGNEQNKCNCPAEFISKIKYSTKCFCGCEDDNDACIRMKKGKEYLSMTDRECLLDNKCGIMECEYGQYIKRLGRCPRRNGD